MATVPIIPFVTTSNDGNASIGHYPEASGQSFAKGAAVNLVAGLVTARVDATDNAKLLGFARHAASGTLNTDVEVDMIEPGREIVISVDNGSGNNKTTADVTCGTHYALLHVSGKATVDSENSDANDKCVIVKRIIDSATAFGRVAIVVADGFYQFD